MNSAPTISSISFAGVRRLNSLDSKSNDLLAARSDWERSREVYEMKQVNVFVGRNGGGKSTVLDLIDQLRNPDRVCNLPRENRSEVNPCFWELTLSTGIGVRGMAAPNEWIGLVNDSNLQSKLDTQALNIELLGVPYAATKPRFFRKNVSKRKLTPKSRSELKALFAELSINVEYWFREKAIAPKEVEVALNKVASLLSGLISDPTFPSSDSSYPSSLQVGGRLPIRAVGGDRFALYLSDDHMQINNVQAEALPSGWRQIASLFTFVNSCPRGSVCILEEPEAHLHASLQRALVRLLAKVARERDLQLFISTHSLTIQSTLTWPKFIDSCFFEVDASRMRQGVRTRQILDDLGINGSDQGTSNGVVWVEGPSDRIYIKHWLRLLCAANSRPEPVEHVDYMFSYHGGALLSHLTAENESVPLVDIACLNRNFVVIMDDDGDFDVDLAAKGSTGAFGKSQMLASIAAIESPNCCGLSTPGYTIEASLPKVYRDRYFRFDGQRLRHFAGKKVIIARGYVKKYLDWDDCFDPKFPVLSMMTSLLEKIDQWNRTR